MLYTKHFYGFEKEGKSAYYLQNTVTGHYFNYRYPINTDKLEETIFKALNTPIESATFLLPPGIAERVKAEEEKAKHEQMLA